jgi:hypothetical protein
MASARAVLGAAMTPGIDAYEAGVRIVTDVQMSVAKAVRFEPVRWLAATCAGATRDVAAAQLSAVRWFLDA